MRLGLRKGVMGESSRKGMSSVKVSTRRDAPQALTVMVRIRDLSVPHNALPVRFIVLIERAVVSREIES